jgi:lipopolysaccharide transport protein LptA
VSCCTEARPLPWVRYGCGTLLAALWTVAALCRPPGAVAAESGANALPCEEPPLCYTASRLEAERNHIVLYNIDIVDRTRGVSRITADRAEASGLDLGDSDVVLTGQVHMMMPEGELRADAATVRFAHKSIASMSAQGNPATFEHALDKGLPTARGHAQGISYDLEHDELQLRGESWLSDGCNEIYRDHILYDIASQHVQADTTPGEAGRVHGTIRSRSAAPCAAGSAAP